VIKLLEGDSYPTQSLILTLLTALESEIRNFPRDSRSDSTFATFIRDLKEGISKAWDELPVDTLLATLLDPRFKNMTSFPQAEIDSAWDILKREYEEVKMARASEISIHSPPHTTTTTTTTPNKRKQDVIVLHELMAKRQKLNNESVDEFERWKVLKEIEYTHQVLTWWKENEKTFPIIAMLAMKYLAVPASQADTERSFSTSKHTISTERTKLSDNHVEKLVVWKQSNRSF
jgi:hypothetical protein